MTSAKLVSALTLIREVISERRSWVTDGVGAHMVAWTSERANNADADMLKAIERTEKLLADTDWRVRDAARILQAQRDGVIQYAGEIVEEAESQLLFVDSMIAEVIVALKDGGLDD
jgi:hypothetical protein